MRGVPHPALMAGVFFLCGFLGAEATAVLCTGQFSGSTFLPGQISWDADNSAYQYTRPYQYNLDCGNGDTSGCHLCRKVVLEEATGDPQSPWSFVGASSWNAGGFACNSTNNSVSVNLTIANLSRATTYRITFYYSVGSCNDDDSYHIADTDIQTTPVNPGG